jgi:acyl carrier protein
VNDVAHKLPSDPRAALAELTAVVAELVRQTHPGASRSVTADSRLETDLGLDSLARIELLHRVEDAFAVRLSEQTLLSIETPRELLTALQSAAGVVDVAAAPIVAAPQLSASSVSGVPEEATTLLEVLAWRVAREGEHRHILFYRGTDQTEELTYAALERGAREVAMGLIERGLAPQQTVAIMLPTCLEFFSSFYGILAAGGIPVPIYPPARLTQIEDHLRRQSTILNSAQAVLLITVPEARLLAQFLRSQVESLAGIVTVEDLCATRSDAALPTPKPEDIAFIQYTSGSTGNPKGVFAHTPICCEYSRLGARRKLR